MDRYEFNLKAEQIRKMTDRGDYKTAMQIADTIDWRRVRNANLLSSISEIYEINREYEEAKDILLLAFDRAPVGKRFLFKLSEISVKAGNVPDAMEFYREFCEVSPDDSRQYLLRYMILKAKGAGAEQLAGCLEQYTNTEIDEKWLYELAVLYAESGKAEECIKTCDRISVLFGEGNYVDQALRLRQRVQSSYEKNDASESKGYYEEAARGVPEEYSDAEEDTTIYRRRNEATYEPELQQDYEVQVQGGAAYQDEAATMQGGAAYQGNAATMQGGAAYQGDAATMQGGAAYQGNAATMQGGAAYQGDAATMQGGAAYQGNAATMQGGVAYQGDAATMQGSAAYQGNAATMQGGVAYQGDAATMQGSATYQGEAGPVQDAISYHGETDGGQVSKNEDFVLDPAGGGDTKRVPDHRQRKSANRRIMPAKEDVLETLEKTIAGARDRRNNQSGSYVDEKASDIHQEKKLSLEKGVMPERTVASNEDGARADASGQEPYDNDGRDPSTRGSEENRQPEIAVSEFKDDETREETPSADDLQVRNSKQPTPALLDDNAEDFDKGMEGDLTNVQDNPETYHMIIEAKTPDSGVRIALDEIRYFHDQYNYQFKIAKVNAEKINRNGFSTFIPKIVEKDLIIENAGSLSYEAIDEISSYITRPKDGSSIIMVDIAHRFDKIASDWPGFVKRFDIVSDVADDAAEEDSEQSDEVRNMPEADRDRDLRETGRNSESGSSGDFRNNDLQRFEATDGRELEARERARIGREDEEYKTLERGERREETERDPGKDLFSPDIPEDYYREMEMNDFAAYAQEYARQIDCVLTGKTILALYERIEQIESAGEKLTKQRAEELIEEAADHAEKPPIGKKLAGMFQSKYDKNDKLILRREDFIY